MESNEYNPDVLNCIANLSSDQVWTSPALANKVLDMFPQELFTIRQQPFSILVVRRVFFFER